MLSVYGCISTQTKLFECNAILVLFNHERNHWTFMVICLALNDACT